VCIDHAKKSAVRLGVDRKDYEFQMLYGVRRDLQRKLADEGYRIRIYVPYGTEWYPYLMRRMAERPANLVFFLRSLIGG
jgi:proline dehydrogenase